MIGLECWRTKFGPLDNNAGARCTLQAKTRCRLRCKWHSNLAVVDSSVLIAIIKSEPEEAEFRRAIKLASSRLLGTATRVAASMVAFSRRGEAGLQELEIVISSLKLDTVPLPDRQATIAIDAFRRYGKGRHKAGLNFGDCLSYALSKATGEPLLFKGHDLTATDITPAV